MLSYKSAVVLAAFVVFTSGIASAQDTGCKNLHLLVSGELSENAKTYDLTVPVDQIGSKDNLSIIHMSLESRNNWHVEVQSNLLTDQPKMISDLNIGFDDDGSQSTIQRLGFQPKSADPLVARSAVALDFVGLKTARDESAMPTVAVESIDDLRCFVQGQLDTTNEVNGGADPKYLYGTTDVPEGYLYEPKQN